MKILCSGRSFTRDVALLEPQKVVSFFELIWKRLGRPPLEELRGHSPPEREIRSLSDVITALVKAFDTGEKYGPKLYIETEALRADLLDLLGEVGPDRVSVGGHSAIVASELSRRGSKVDLLVPYPERRPGLKEVTFILPDGSIGEPEAPERERLSILLRISPGIVVHLDEPLRANGSTRVLIVDQKYRPVERARGKEVSLVSSTA